MSRWIRNAQRTIGWRAWTLGILGFLALSSLAPAEQVKFRATGQFTTKSYYGTVPLCEIGDTWVAEFTYETETVNVYAGRTDLARYANAIVDAHVDVYRANAKVQTFGFGGGLAPNTIFVFSNYAGYPNKDGVFLDLPLSLVDTAGMTRSGYVRIMLMGPLGTMVPADLSLPAELPVAADSQTFNWTVGGENMTGSVQSVMQVNDRPRFVAWVVQSQITSVPSYGSLAGIVLPGDTLSATYYLRTDKADTAPDANTGAYSGCLLLADVLVEHDGEPVWMGTYEGATAQQTVYLLPQPWAPQSRQLAILDVRVSELLGTGSPDCRTTLFFSDTANADMLANDSFLLAPPDNSESAYLDIRIYGSTSARASILAGDVVAVELQDEVAFLERIADSMDRETELVAEIASKNQVIASKNQEIASKQTEISALESQTAALDEQIDSLAGPSYVAWKYDTPITGVGAGSALEGTIQVGDILHGLIIMNRETPDIQTSTDEESTYVNPVIHEELYVTRDGETVWSASGTPTSSALYLETNMNSSGQQILNMRYEILAAPDCVAKITFLFADHAGQDMLLSDKMPVVPPLHRESTYLNLHINGVFAAYAPLAEGEMFPVSLTDNLEKQQALSSQIDTLTAEEAALQQRVDDLVGTRYAVWTYQATITSKSEAAAMGGAVQVGDVITGTMVLDREAPPAAPGAEFSYIPNPVVMAKAEVVRDGATIWRVDQPVATSMTEIWTNLNVLGRQEILTDCTMSPQDGTTYRILVQAMDEAGYDMFAAPKIPAMPPATWDYSHVTVIENGAYVAIGKLIPGSLKCVPVNGHVAWEKELEAKASALQQQLAAANADIAAKQAQIDTLTAERAALQQQLDAANADIAAKQAQIDTLTAEKAALQQQLDAANADIVAKQAQIDALTADLAEANAEIAARGARIEALTNELNEANATIAALTQTVSDLEAANAAYDAQVTSIAGNMAALEATLADEFNDPNFAIPGDSPEAKAANLKAAILSLNPGQRQALFRALGGDKNAR